MDRAHALAPGLFRSLGPGDRKRLKLDITYDYGNDEKLEFWGKDPLGVFDMRVFQGLIAIAGPDGWILENSQKADETGQNLLTRLYEPADEEIRNAVIKPRSLEIGTACDAWRAKSVHRKMVQASSASRRPLNAFSASQ